MIAEDNALFRMPIVVSGNMISVGFNPLQIAGMLQIKPTWYLLGSDEEKCEEKTETKPAKKVEARPAKRTVAKSSKKKKSRKKK